MEEALGVRRSWPQAQAGGSGPGQGTLWPRPATRHIPHRATRAAVSQQLNDNAGHAAGSPSPPGSPGAYPPISPPSPSTSYGSPPGVAPRNEQCKPGALPGVAILRAKPRPCRCSWSLCMAASRAQERHGHCASHAPRTSRRATRGPLGDCPPHGATAGRCSFGRRIAASTCCAQNGQRARPLSLACTPNNTPSSTHTPPLQMAGELPAAAAAPRQATQTLGGQLGAAPPPGGLAAPDRTGTTRTGAPAHIAHLAGGACRLGSTCKWQPGAIW